MTMHKKDRNIVRANAIGSTLDIAFGPSDDDFHYNSEHATISHEDRTVTSGKRLGVKLIFQGGGCEMAWAHGEDFDAEYKYDGYVHLTANGALCFPFWSVDENDDQKMPFWVEFTSTGLKVYAFEGEPPTDRDQYLVFDSNTVNVPED